MAFVIKLDAILLDSKTKTNNHATNNRMRDMQATTSCNVQTEWLSVGVVVVFVVGRAALLASRECACYLGLACQVKATFSVGSLLVDRLEMRHFRRSIAAPPVLLVVRGVRRCDHFSTGRQLCRRCAAVAVSKVRCLDGRFDAELRDRLTDGHRGGQTVEALVRAYRAAAHCYINIRHTRTHTRQNGPNMQHTRVRQTSKRCEIVCGVW